MVFSHWWYSLAKCNHKGHNYITPKCEFTSANDRCQSSKVSTLQTHYIPKYWAKSTPAMKMCSSNRAKQWTLFGFTMFSLCSIHAHFIWMCLLSVFIPWLGKSKERCKRNMWSLMSWICIADFLCITILFWCERSIWPFDLLCFQWNFLFRFDWNWW